MISQPESKQSLYRILKIFNPLAIDLLGCSSNNIDIPANVITLTTRNHHLFTKFNIIFEQVTTSPPLPQQQQHTYKIDKLWHGHYLQAFSISRRTLFLPSDGSSTSIEPPSPILLRIHAAIGRILHLSGADRYIDRVVEDAHDMHLDGYVSGDGSSRVDNYVKYKLGGALIPLY